MLKLQKENHDLKKEITEISVHLDEEKRSNVIRIK